jgi:hypothetical protein
MKKIVLFPICVILTQGCTAISQPTASRSLVEQQFVVPSASVDSSLSAALSHSKTGTILAIEEQNLEIGNTFFAATGLNCRKVSLQQKGNDIYCFNDQGDWFKVNKVISEYNENELRETDL